LSDLAVATAHGGKAKASQRAVGGAYVLCRLTDLENAKVQLRLCVKLNEAAANEVHQRT
jgi:hypothetical protein